MNDAKLQRLIDKDEIRDLICRYSRGVDRGDWKAVRAVYHDDAHDHHGDYIGDIDGLIDLAQARLGKLSQVSHFLGNCLIEFANPDVAVVETYYMTAHTLGTKEQREFRVGDGSEAVQISTHGRYVDRVERRADCWRIAERVVVYEAIRTFVGDGPPLKPEWAPFSRDKNDPIYRMREKAGIEA